MKQRLQLINHLHGGEVTRKSTREDGVFPVQYEGGPSLLFQGIEAPHDVLLTHGKSTSELLRARAEAERWRVQRQQVTRARGLVALLNT